MMVESSQSARVSECVDGWARPFPLSLQCFEALPFLADADAF